MPRVGYSQQLVNLCVLRQHRLTDFGFTLRLRRRRRFSTRSSRRRRFGCFSIPTTTTTNSLARRQDGHDDDGETHLADGGVVLWYRAAAPAHFADEELPHGRVAAVRRSIPAAPALNILPALCRGRGSSEAGRQRCNKFFDFSVLCKQLEFLLRG